MRERPAEPVTATAVRRVRTEEEKTMLSINDELNSRLKDLIEELFKNGKHDSCKAYVFLENERYGSSRFLEVCKREREMLFKCPMNCEFRINNMDELITTLLYPNKKSARKKSSVILNLIYFLDNPENRTNENKKVLDYVYNILLNMEEEEMVVYFTKEILGQK